MGDLASTNPTDDGQEHVLAAARHLVKALGASKNLSDDTRRLLMELDSHLSSMARISDSRAEEIREFEQQLKFAEQKIVAWASNPSMIWASGSRETASDYLQAVYEIQRITESFSGRDKELLGQAHTLLHMAMERLEEELLHILLEWKKQSQEPAFFISFRLSEEGVVYDESFVSTDNDSVEDASRRYSTGTEPDQEYCSLDLVHPDAVLDIKSIANTMFASHYDQEFCRAFVDFWRDVLDEYIVILGIDKFGIEDLLKMEWRRLNCKVKKWIRALKFVVRVYLASEKRLFYHVLGQFGSVCSDCFVEASKASMLCLLNFGEAMAIGTRRPEKLFCLLDMYEVLADLLRDIDSLFSEEAGSCVREEFHELVNRLSDTTRATFMEFGNAVASDKSTTAFPGGGVHHLTKYVMNYISTLTGYAETLNSLLEKDASLPQHLQSLTFDLEFNLDSKSRLYKDGSLIHIFMMNNIYYMVQKVKGSDLAELLGDEWIRDYTVKFQQHARSYERGTWVPLLSLLRDDGNLGKTLLKERYRGFNNAFEEVYKIQTTWSIPDGELRKDLRISISQKVIQAYRSFAGKNSAGEKYSKYTADDLENYILDLFKGSSAAGSLLHNNGRKRVGPKNRRPGDRRELGDL
ncbi:exocyst complex component EXO70E2 [Diospyros lotus]|uniref:exocyst complex component EXO70E2 n=1 Tax=Diospyros lotus TaxID=55363 RepID=UPI00225655BF|nr:exocyst complex component EXO70E2 [Diospyros lotus]